jgi:hypothetical protein
MKRLCEFMLFCQDITNAQYEIGMTACNDALKLFPLCDQFETQLYDWIDEQPQYEGEIEYVINGFFMIDEIAKTTPPQIYVTSCIDPQASTQKEKPFSSSNVRSCSRFHSHLLLDVSPSLASQFQLRDCSGWTFSFELEKYKNCEAWKITKSGNIIPV